MLWGGRFSEKLNDEAMRFSSSLAVDVNLFSEDILLSQAHAKMLANCGIITPEESSAIIKGLEQIEAEWKSGEFSPEPAEYEDVHSAIETRLTQLIGTTAGKLHSGRSRNDQIATGMRLWMKKSCLLLKEALVQLQKTLVNKAKDNIYTLMPGYTHLQRAQPISLAFHLLAYVEMIQRDKRRIDFTYSDSDASPLGSSALAGSTLPLDRTFTAKEMGFAGVTNNALDSVSDRDFMLDFLHACSVIMMHLSRLSEEIILWSTSEWKFIRLSDKYTTGSSLMPQKKNPDMAELIRGKSGRAYANLMMLMTTMKSLPLSYNRDMQEDKAPVFDSFNITIDSLRLMQKMIETMHVNKERFVEEMKHDYSLSTDLADHLVMRGIPFRDSHHIVGQIVKYAEEHDKDFCDLSLDELKAIHSVFDEESLECLKLEGCLERKKTYGSPNPSMVKTQIEKWHAEL